MSEIIEIIDGIPSGHLFIIVLLAFIFAVAFTVEFKDEE